jgi:hypothetical protein
MKKEGKEHESREPRLQEEAVRLDGERVRFLRAGALFAATRASIFLTVALARLGRPESIPEVIEELRRTVRQARRNAEVVFALYYVTNAVARGEDLEEAAAGAMARLRRCRRDRHMEPNSSSGTNQGAGASERRRSMKTQQMDQELKSERVQEEMAAEEPFRVYLKSERVQEPALADAWEESTSLELTLPQQQPVTITLQAFQIVITLHSTTAGQAG